MPLLKEVVSSNIHSLGYDAASQVLAVRFKRAGEPAPEVYQHKDVPPEIGETLIAMDTGIGGAYAKLVRGKFEHEVVQA